MLPFPTQHMIVQCFISCEKCHSSCWKDILLNGEGSPVSRNKETSWDVWGLEPKYLFQLDASGRIKNSSIHPLYSGSGRGGSRVFQTSLSPSNSSSSSWGGRYNPTSKFWVCHRVTSQLVVPRSALRVEASGRHPNQVPKPPQLAPGPSSSLQPSLPTEDTQSYPWPLFGRYPKLMISTALPSGSARLHLNSPVPHLHIRTADDACCKTLHLQQRTTSSDLEVLNFPVTSQHFIHARYVPGAGSVQCHLAETHRKMAGRGQNQNQSKNKKRNPKHGRQNTGKH